MNLCMLVVDAKEQLRRARRLQQYLKGFEAQVGVKWSYANGCMLVVEGKEQLG